MVISICFLKVKQITIIICLFWSYFFVYLLILIRHLGKAKKKSMKQKGKIYGLILTWLLLLLAGPVYADWKKPQIINLNREAYKADNKNWSIGQDEYGTLYFGNDIGLLEFDGIEWRLNELPGFQTVRSLAVAPHRTIFTGSYEEFGRWDRDLSGRLVYTSLSALLQEQELSNDDFWKISIADNGVYFQSFNAIYQYDYSTVRKIPFDKGFLFLYQVRGKHFVQEIKGGVLELEDMRLSPIADNGLFNDTDVRVILPYGENEYLLGTAMDGLYIYDGENVTPFHPGLSQVLSKMELNCGLLSSKGTYFLGTILDGIYEVDEKGNILNHISSRNNLQNNTILALYEDSRGNIWVALDRGISYIQYLDYMSCMTDPGGNTGAFYDVALWQNKLFLGTNQGVFYIDAGDIEKPNVFAGIKLVDGTQGQVWKLRIIDGKLFCCHNRGLKEILPDLRVTESYKLETGVYDMAAYTLKGKDLFLFFHLQLPPHCRTRPKRSIFPGRDCRTFHRCFCGSFE